MLKCAEKLNGKTRLLKALYVEYSVREMLKVNPDSDYSPAGILYCSAAEDYCKQTIVAALREKNPTVKSFNKPLQECNDDKIAIGNIFFMIGDDLNGKKGLLEIESDIGYWEELRDEISIVKNLRNDCCHSKTIKSDDVEKLRNHTFAVLKKLTECDKLLDYFKGGTDEQRQ